MRSQLTFYKESIRQKRRPRPRLHRAFCLWLLKTPSDFEINEIRYDCLTLPSTPVA
jgi:hypothetical protein